MSIELIAISSFVVAILGALGHFTKKSNLKSCRMCCIDSDCRDEDKATDLKMKELNEKIERNEKKIHKNKVKLEDIKTKKRLSIGVASSVPETPVTPVSQLSEISVFEEQVTEI